jgi:hypothetical protein
VDVPSRVDPMLHNWNVEKNKFTYINIYEESTNIIALVNEMIKPKFQFWLLLSVKERENSSAHVPHSSTESRYSHTDLLERMRSHHPDCTWPSAGYWTNILCSTSTCQLSEEIKVGSWICSWASLKLESGAPKCVHLVAMGRGFRFTNCTKLKTQFAIFKYT